MGRQGGVKREEKKGVKRELVRKGGEYWKERQQGGRKWDEEGAGRTQIR